MKIHSDIIDQTGTFYAAAQDKSYAVSDITKVGSKSRRNAFNVYLGGSARARSQHWDGYDYVKAATYDEWGFFIATLYEIDPNMIAGPYKGIDDFNTKTKHAYIDGKVIA